MSMKYYKKYLPELEDSQKELIVCVDKDTDQFSIADKNSDRISPIFERVKLTICFTYVINDNNIEKAQEYEALSNTYINHNEIFKTVVAETLKACEVFGIESFDFKSKYFNIEEYGYNSYGVIFNDNEELFVRIEDEYGNRIR